VSTKDLVVILTTTVPDDFLQERLDVKIPPEDESKYTSRLVVRVLSDFMNFTS